MQIALIPDEADFAAAMRPDLDPSKMKVQGEIDVPADPVAAPGVPQDIYGAGVFPYTEADSVYISLMSMFHHFLPGEPHPGPDTGDVRLAISRDGRHFFRPGNRQPFLRLGPAGAFDSKWIWALPRPVRMGDELWIYYFGTNQDHSRRLDPAAKTQQSAISRAVLRLDGFVSADFDYTGGSMITPLIRFSGKRLEVNLDTSAGGWGKVEMLDEQGTPVPGFRFQDAEVLNGNSVQMVVSWRGQSSVASLQGKAVRLHMKMRATKLYAFQFR